MPLASNFPSGAVRPNAPGFGRFNPHPAPRRPAPPVAPAPQRPFVQHNVGILGFHNEAFIIARPTDPRAGWLAERAVALPQRFHPEKGRTNLTAAIRASLELMASRPTGSVNGITLLTDGHANEQTEQIWAAVSEAVKAGVSIDTIAFGGDADEATLRRISECTLGRFMRVDALRSMVAAFVANAERLDQRARGGLSCNVLAIDLSHSMKENAGNGQAKIALVRDAAAALLKWYAARYPNQLVA